MLAKRRKLFLILSIVLAVAIVVTVVLLNVLLSKHILNETNNGITLLLILLIVAFGTGTSFVLIKYISYNISFKNAMSENKFYFGIDDYLFPNLDLFKKTLIGLNKANEDDVYFIVFTPCGQELSLNLTRNEIVTKYNGLISKFIESYFGMRSMHHAFDNSYCYHRNMFGVLVKGNQEKISKIIEDLQGNLYEIARNNEIHLFVQPYFGVAKLEKHMSIEEAFENATLAKYQSERNFEPISYYTSELRTGAKLSDAEEILEGLRNQEFEVYYQPKFSLNSHTFISSEALVRWNSKKNGFLYPSQFIDKAERAGLIHDIDMYVFNKVCEDINEAKRKGRRVIPISINFSLYEFYSPSFISDIIKLIDKNNVPRNLIEIEITESTSQSNPFLAISIMKQLKEKGLRILMDDFGVGYSNFSNLRQIPIDCIKIDKSFIDHIIDDQKTREIVRFLIAFAKNSDLEVIAEGVDKREQVEILKRYKLDTIQGYYYAKPLAKQAYEEFLISNRFEKKGELEWF